MNSEITGGSGDGETTPHVTAAKTIANAYRIDVERQKQELDDRVQALESIDEDIAKATLAIVEPGEAAYWLLDSSKVSAFWPHRLNLGLLRTPVEVAKTPLGKVEVLDLIDKLSRCKRGQRRPAASGS